MKKITIYTDGAAAPNPGPAGYGVVLMYGTVRKELSAGFRLSTNNRMELLAVVAGLEALREPCDVTIYTDSKYVSRAVTDRWLENWQRKGWMTSGRQPVKNRDLWERLSRMLDRHEVTMKWVKGHSGVPENERCDELAVAAAQLDERLEDDGFVAEAG